MPHVLLLLSHYILGLNSECPAGTKCVQEYFCDENAVMVSYRVSLTKAQKQKRGSLPVRYLLSEEIPKLIFFQFLVMYQWK